MARLQLTELKSGLDQYFADNKIHPSTQQGLNALTQKPTGDSGKLPQHFADGGYLKKVIEKDPWGNDYFYESYDQNGFAIYSAGPDGKPLTEDDIRD